MSMTIQPQILRAPAPVLPLVYEPTAFFVREKLPSQLFASPNPVRFFPRDILAELQITDVFLLLNGKEGDDVKQKYLDRKINVLHFPITDFQAPTQEDLKTNIPEMVKLLQEPGHRVLIHCQGGLGRTGTIVACLAITILEIKGYEAISYVRSKIKGAIETKVQEIAIHLFADPNYQIPQPRLNPMPVNSLSPPNYPSPQYQIQATPQVSPPVGIAVAAALTPPPQHGYNCQEDPRHLMPIEEHHWHQFPTIRHSGFVYPGPGFPPYQGYFPPRRY